jgi:hypothetical protein
VSGADPSTTPEQAPDMSGPHGLPPGHSCWLVRSSCRRCWDWMTGVPRCASRGCCGIQPGRGSASRWMRRDGDRRAGSRPRADRHDFDQRPQLERRFRRLRLPQPCRMVLQVRDRDADIQSSELASSENRAPGLASAWSVAAVPGRRHRVFGYRLLRVPESRSRAG